MSQGSNIDAVVAYLDDFARSINMTRPGREGSLGKDLAMTIIRGPDVGSMGGIMGRCAQKVGPDGTPWPPNAPEYAEWKEEKYGWVDAPNQRTNQMLSQVALYGRTRIEPEQVTLVYGEDKPPSTSYAPTGYLSKDDERKTDVQKATYAHTGQSKKRVKRPFYGLGQGDAENVTKVAQENADALIRDTNAANGV